MVLLILVVLGAVCGAFALAVIHAETVSAWVRALAGRWLDPRRGGISPRQGLFLIPVVAMTMLLLGPGNWFGFQSVDGLVTGPDRAA